MASIQNGQLQSQNFLDNTLSVPDITALEDYINNNNLAFAGQVVHVESTGRYYSILDLASTDYEVLAATTGLGETGDVSTSGRSADTVLQWTGTEYEHVSVMSGVDADSVDGLHGTDLVETAGDTMGGTLFFSESSTAKGGINAGSGEYLEVLDAAGTSQGELHADVINVNTLNVQSLNKEQTDVLEVQDVWIETNVGGSDADGGLVHNRGTADVYMMWDEGTDQFGQRVGPSGTFEPFVRENQARWDIDAQDANTVGGHAPSWFQDASNLGIGGQGLESDGASPASLRVASTAAGDGLQGGSGAALAVDVSDFAGSYLSGDGSENLQVNLGAGVDADGSDNVRVNATSVDTGILPVAHGGTGVDGSAVTAGQLLIGNATASGYDLSTLTEGTHISVTSGDGAITIGVGVETAFDLASNDLESGTTTIWDESEGYIPQGRLQNTAITAGAGNGLSSSGDGTLALGESQTYSVDMAAVSGHGLESDGTATPSVRIASAAISTGLSGGSGTALSLDQTVLTDGGAKALDVSDLAGAAGTANQVPLTDGAAVAWGTLPNAGLTNDSVSVAGNTVSLGGSTAVALTDLSDVSSATLTVSPGDGLSSDGDGALALGDTETYSVNVADIAGHGLESDGGAPADLRIDATALGTGLAGGGGTDLSLDETVLTGGGAKELDVADLAGGAGVADQVPVTDGSAVTWASLPNAGLTNDSVTASPGDGLASTGDGTLALGESETYSVVPSDFAGHGLKTDAGTPPDLQIDGSVLSTGLSGGSGTDLTLDENVLTDGGAKELDVADLAGGAGTADQVPVTDGAAVAWDTVPNAGLSNSSVTVAGNSVSLGSSTGVAVGDLTGDTDGLSEGSTNQFHTDERAQDAVGSIMGGNFSYSDTAPSITLLNDTVTVAGNDVTLGSSTTVALTDLSDIGTTTVTDGDVLAADGTEIASESITSLTENHVSISDLKNVDSTVNNSLLTNSSVTVAGNAVSLGASTTIAIADLSDVTGVTALEENTAANKPVAGTEGRLFFNTTDQIVEYDDGSAWLQLGVTDHSNLTNIGADDHHAQDQSSNYKDGGSYEIDVADFSGAKGTDGQVPVSDGASVSWTTLENSALTNDTITVTPGNGLQSGGDSTITLGGSETYSVDLTALSGHGIESDGSAEPSLRIDAAALSTGISGGSGTNLSIDETVLTDGGAKALDVADFAGASGASGEVPVSNGSAVSWGTVGNSTLTNDTVTVGGNDVSLGGSTTISVGDLSDVTGVAALTQDTEANRPAASTTGRIYVASDTQAIYRDTGSAWELVGTAPANLGAGDVGLGNVPNTDATNASNISSGTLPSGRLSGSYPIDIGGDADTLDGVEGANYARTDQSETFSNGVTIQGDLAVEGTTFTTQSETVQITDNLLLLNKGEVGTGISEGTVGLEADRGDGEPIKLIYEESSKALRVGVKYQTVAYSGLTGTFEYNEEIVGQSSGANAIVRNDTGSDLQLKGRNGTFTAGETVEGQASGATATADSITTTDQTQAAATREDSPEDTGVPFWNSTRNRMDTSSDITWSGSELSVTGSIDFSGSITASGTALGWSDLGISQTDVSASDAGLGSTDDLSEGTSNLYSQWSGTSGQITYAAGQENAARIVGNGSALASPYTLSVQNDDTGASTWIEILNGTAGEGAFFGMSRDGASNDNFQIWNYQAGYIEFFTNSATASGTRRLSISPGGKVNVGSTQEAGYKLDVEGDINTTTGTLRVGGTKFVDTIAASDVGLGNLTNDAQVVNAGSTPSIEANTSSNRPAASTAGRLYIETDNNEIYRDTGSSWVAIGGGGGSLTELSDVSSAAQTDGNVLASSGSSYGSESISTLVSDHVGKSDVGLSNVPNTNIAYASTIPADAFTSSEVTNLRNGQLEDGTTPWTSNNYFGASDARTAVEGTSDVADLASGLTASANYVPVSDGTGGVSWDDPESHVHSKYTDADAQGAVSASDVGLGSVENVALSTAGWTDIGISQSDISKSDVDLGSVPNTDIAYSSTIPADSFTSTEVSNLRSGQLDDGSTPWTSNNNYTDADARGAVQSSITHVGLDNIELGNITSNEGNLAYDDSEGLKMYWNGSWRQIFSEGPTASSAGWSDLAISQSDVSKGDVGLGNVPNADATNASNIDSGTLPSGRLSGTYSIDISGDADTVDGYDYTDLARPKNSATFTSTNTSLDINQTSWTDIPWDVQLDVDGGYTHDPSGSPAQITFDNAGTYRVYAQLTFQTSGTRENPAVRFAINGSGRDAVGAGGYMRGASGHSEASSSVMEMITVSAGDTLKVQSTEYADGATVNLRSRESSLVIEQVSKTVARSGDADTVDGYNAADFVLAGGDTITGQITMTSGSPLQFNDLASSGDKTYFHGADGSGDDVVQIIRDGNNDYRWSFPGGVEVGGSKLDWGDLGISQSDISPGNLGSDPNFAGNSLGFNGDTVMKYDDGNDSGGAGWSGKDGIVFQGDNSTSKAALYAGHIQTKGAAEFQGRGTFTESYGTVRIGDAVSGNTDPAINMRRDDWNGGDYMQIRAAGGSGDEWLNIAWSDSGGLDSIITFYPFEVELDESLDANGNAVTGASEVEADQHTTTNFSIEENSSSNSLDFKYTG